MCRPPRARRARVAGCGIVPAFASQHVRDIARQPLSTSRRRIASSRPAGNKGPAGGPLDRPVHFIRKGPGKHGLDLLQQFRLPARGNEDPQAGAAVLAHVPERGRDGLFRHRIEVRDVMCCMDCMNCVHRTPHGRRHRAKCVAGGAALLLQPGLQLLRMGIDELLRGRRVVIYRCLTARMCSNPRTETFRFLT